ncbi:DUF218 domain-containing protein [Rathayibacter oskolensis]|uniref:DUF218 domain-containing protein n=1 Tax=Rathayibacter oskolensis TaxID=1891671 RepID=A0A1X7MTH7_9MICO|nr:YdcF family protein [Rathayibacter oskolensis]SMH27924.1 DUF218 domain-containing protein [Rathayibacter oskolensis]
MRGRLLLLPVGLVAAVLGWAEWQHWRASCRRLGSPSPSPGREAVVVLGFRNRGVRANAANRYRVRAGLRSRDPRAVESVLVLCGGSVGGAVPEAVLMARYAREDRGCSGPVLLDCDSRTTWENIANAVPLIASCDTIKIVSHSLHAEKARAYLWRQRPDLARRLVRADEYRLGEILLVKPIAAVIGLAKLRRLRDGASFTPGGRPPPLGP